jgi:NAD(P)-dependent dehydrogenase (short-subunit alcohol dehydrogenase family)
VSERVLFGRTAIVTGASQGLGREIARYFLAAGAGIVICARSADDIDRAAAELQTAYPDCTVLAKACDISRTEDLDRLFDAAVSTFGTLDILVNNAGIHGPIGPIDTIDWAAWQQAIAVNLNGTVYACRRAVQHFKGKPADRHRKIINLSGGGATAPQPGLTAYGASKAGLARFTETLAEEVKAFGIDVNAVAPGALKTRLLDELLAAGPQNIGEQYHGRVCRLKEDGASPMVHAAQLAVFLASAASDGVTGKLISALWDNWPMWPAHIDELQRSDIYTLRRITGRDRGAGWGDK